MNSEEVTRALKAYPDHPDAAYDLTDAELTRFNKLRDDFPHLDAAALQKEMEIDARRWPNRLRRFMATDLGMTLGLLGLLGGVGGGLAFLATKYNDPSDGRLRYEKTEAFVTTQVLQSTDRMRQLGVCAPELAAMRDAVTRYPSLQAAHPGPEAYDNAIARAPDNCLPPKDGSVTWYTGMYGGMKLAVTGEMVTKNYDVQTMCMTGNTDSLHPVADAPEVDAGFREDLKRLEQAYQAAC